MNLQRHLGTSHHLGYWLLLAFAVCVYASGLGGHFIPRNGDEMVYAHIARLTAASNHLVPLVSELNNMRNTKPPLVFWQAIVAGDWGAHWSLLALRLPSLVYTLLVTAGIVYGVKRLSGALGLGLLAGTIYLAFFCTFRYGRPYLTSAAESFWFNLPLFILFLRHARAGAQAALFNWALVVPFGLILGCGLLYKSFALIVPAGACLALVAWLLTKPSSLVGYIQLALKISISGAVALGVFALWFVIDPDPHAVWSEFVVGENAGKMNNAQGYWQTALWSGSSIWVQLLGYAQNAGLLAGLVLGAMVWGVRQAWQWRHTPVANADPNTAGQTWPIDSRALLALLACLALWLLIFTLPSQRSARYLIPATPFLAVVLALLWQRLHALWFGLSLLAVALALMLLSVIGWAAYQLGIASAWQWVVMLLSLALGAGAVLAGLHAAYLRHAVLLGSIAVLAAFNAVVAPLDSSTAALTEAHSAQWRGKHIAVPDGFNGDFERYQFVLPGNRYSTYKPASPLESLLPQFDAVMLTSAQAPDCVTQKTCTLVASRWHLRSRHTSGEITLANVLKPQEWLFRREWMVSR